MTVVGTEDGTFSVVDRNGIVETGFATSAAAWRWIDRHEGEAISKSEQRAEWSWNQRVNAE